ncbi:cytochrome c, partial [Gammaproteobacteria bacterium]|nr:cytochrome c [Gammaproteobacteria bacterium]
MRVIFTIFLLIGALTQGQAAHHETDEGADVFQANCAYCHNQNLPRMPTRDQLLEREVKEVYSAITSGIMAPYSRDLSPDERRSVSEYVTGKKLGDYASGAAAIPKEAYCANQTKSPVR